MSISIEVLDTDITALEVDAIANAANTELLHGGGVAGAISRAGGEVLDRESEAAAPIGLGEAVETSGGNMPCRWVIHAATMELGGPTSAEIIERATASTLAVAERLGVRSLALVAFGTGVGGFPVTRRRGSRPRRWRATSRPGRASSAWCSRSGARPRGRRSQPRSRPPVPSSARLAAAA